MSIFIGSGVAAVTPFNQDNSVNYKVYEKHIDWLISNGSDAIVSCGTTGESSTMDDTEHLETIRQAVNFTNKRVPLIAGTGSNDTKHAIKLAIGAEKAGADALLIVTPYYNKTTQNGLIKHYKDVAKETTLPIILYNIAGRTGLNIEPETMLELCQIKNIVAVKEASGSIDQVTRIVSLCGKDIDIYSGNDNQVVPLLSLGSKGVITTIGNIMPMEMHTMVMDFLTGNVKESLELQINLLPLIDALFREVNPIPIKKAVNLLGFEVGECRAPLYEIEEDHLIELKNEMIKCKLI